MKHSFLICLSFLLFVEIRAIRKQEVQITFPERLDVHRSKRDLSTAIDGDHESSASFNVNNWVLDTKRNNELAPKTVTVRQFLADNSEVLHEDEPDNCHYQGSIRGVPDSTVVLNTCEGLRGIIDDGKDTFHIEPHDEQKDTGAHKLYLANNDEEFDATKNCGTHSDEHFHKAFDDESKLSATIKRLRRSVVNMEEKYRSYLTTDETRYNEVLFVVDNEIYRRYENNTKTVIDKVLTLCNAVDAIYQRINVRIVMTAIEIWTNGDRIERQTSGGAELGKFQEYRQAQLIGKIPHDNGHFLSSHGWSGGVIGMAWVGTMCNRLSAGVNTWSFGSVIGPYVVLAHEMGHNFGYSHDSGYCKCLTPKGCFMGGHKTRVPGFSNCSLTSMKRINDRCLYNKPTVLRPQCGNGIQEGDEECDCGTPEMCKTKDPCCQPHDCKLKPSAVCSDLHHSCCKGCQYKRQGTLCRPVETDCDAPEYCPGDARDCPDNSYIQNGVPCNQTQKLFVGNTNRNSVVMRSLSPRIEARYVRINPQYWYNWICMRAELYGCSANEVDPTTPTPIKPYNDYCVVPKNETLIPHEKSKIVFKSGRMCNQKYMDFRLDANGVLWHHSSGRRVCPENGGTGNGVRLVISSSCTDEDSKYIRTSKHSLKHVKTGRCIHPNGGWPGNGRELVIYSGCDQTRLQLLFMKPDCIVPLGLSTQEIPDDQITASSSRGSSESPHFGRLHNSKYWCAAQKKNTEYLQIDLGKAQTINKIGTQGRTNWYDWVTDYFLEYSQDGQRWTKYSESGNSATSNSYCFSGKCAETRDTQCRNLWGPDSNNANQGCYDKLNTEAKGFGTCDPASNSSCTASNILCGQVQCLSNRNSPVVDYGKTYQKLTLQDSTQCSAAVLKTNSDSLGLGMVTDGTKCGDQKMCSNYECKSFAELNIKACPQANGKECNGQGLCTNTGVCHCDAGYDPDTACVKALVTRDGGYGAWSAWSTCTAGCNGGTQSRHRFCNNPFPQHGGKDCEGEREQQRDCNTDACPRAHSCRQLQKIAMAANKFIPDGVYKIYPYGLDKGPITAYCDMSRDGGGWTLLVSSHTNSWTSQNVRLRNQDSPSLTSDYSILKHADDIKNNLNVVGSKFEYRLEAQSRGRWGGIWEADRSYTFTATNNGQTNVQLIKKFDNWNYANNGIEKRMPWISGAKLTTSVDANSNWYGSITGDAKNYHPAPWIRGHLMEIQPEYIWYWIREGPWELPRSCMEVQMRGLQTTPQKDGVYLIKPPGKKDVKTYCDLTSHGGGWTLLATSKTHTGWTVDNVKQRNTGNPSLDADYSILEFADAIKDFDVSQDFFQYRIEADGSNQYGGIFDAPSEYTFTSTCDKQTNVKMVENFNGIGQNTNLVRRMPRLGLSSKIFLSSGSVAKDSSGSIIYNDGSDDSPSYLPNVKENPGVVRYWMREGTRRSCNDIKVHGTTTQYEDDYYMIRLVNDSTYFPVFCDMTSDLGAFTLVVTSRHNTWTRDQVPARNVYRPSTSNDYSILKYADLIKNLGHNNTFKYKLDANERGHWGGVWSAPRDYSFMSTSSSHTKVTLLEKFDAWSFSWWQSVQNRMPWFDANGQSNKALLTTSSSTTYYPAGSIIWGDKDRHPAEWMRFGGMMNPGVIWYWVNEDDCDLDRLPVDGGLSEWGPWEKCDQLCANGKQTRRRTCTNPEPRCGGLQCSASEKTLEERPCYTCPESPIRSYGGYCVQPKSGDCNPKENTTTWSHSLIFRRADTNCSADYMNFLFDTDGVIYHKCSGKIVCPDGNYVANNRKLLLKDKCPQDVSMHRRLTSKSLQNKKNNYCVHPLGGWPSENRYLIYYSGCNEARLSLDFFNLPTP